MGCRSDVMIICEEKIFKLLKEKYEEHSFKPRVQVTPTGQYFLSWEWVKWYSGAFEEIIAIEKVLDMCLGDEYRNEQGYAFKFFKINEDNATDERGNERAYDIFDDYYLNVSVNTSDNLEEYEKKS